MMESGKEMRNMAMECSTEIRSTIKDNGRTEIKKGMGIWSIKSMENRMWVNLYVTSDRAKADSFTVMVVSMLDSSKLICLMAKDNWSLSTKIVIVVLSEKAGAKAKEFITSVKERSLKVYGITMPKSKGSKLCLTVIFSKVTSRTTKDVRESTSTKMEIFIKVLGRTISNTEVACFD